MPNSRLGLNFAVDRRKGPPRVEPLSFIREARRVPSDTMPDVRLIHDPQGREILLDDERWAHIVDGHPELRDIQQEVLRAVESPSEVLAGRMPDEEWFYLGGAGPSRWLKVVVVFSPQGSGRIITAFGRRRKP